MGAPGQTDAGTGKGTALITGASSGIGRGLGEALARRGWAVGLAARREAELVRVAEGVREAGGRARALQCDVGVRKAVVGAVRELEKAFGPVDLLVANAGVSEDTPARTLDAGQIERIFRVNVLGMVYAVEAVLPGMLERGRGHLVGISSVAGFRGLPLRPGYSASKAAMSSFLEGLRVDLRGSGVDVTVVSPGWVRTPMTAKNEHPMPFLVELDDAVERIIRGIEGRRRHVAFPWPLATAVRVLRFLPPALYDWLGSRLVPREPRH